MSEPQQQEQEIQELDINTMSDEEFNKLPFPEDIPGEEDAPQEIIHDDISDEGDEEAEVSEGVEEEEQEEREVEIIEESDAEEVEEVSEESSEEELKDEGFKQTFKVGDEEFTVNSKEELITLAQRGLGANKRMQELAPNLKTMKMLENNGLLDKDKLNFLIALDKKDPDAIRKLVADSGVDTFDASAGDPLEPYVAPDNSVSDSEMAVEDAFTAISATPSFDATVNTLKGFDEASKAEIIKDPSVIKQISDHHENGYYNEIKSIVAKQRLLGDYVGVSDLNAYKHVWNTIQEHSARMDGNPEAGHKNLTSDQESGENLAGTEGTQEAVSNASNDKRVSKATDAARKAAEVTNKSRGSRQAETIDIDKLTDAEVMDLDITYFDG